MSLFQTTYFSDKCFLFLLWKIHLLFVLRARTTSLQWEGSLNTNNMPQVLECRLAGNRIPICVLVIQQVGLERCFTVTAQVVYGQKEQSICLTSDKNQTPCCGKLNCFQFAPRAFIWIVVTSRSILVNKDRKPCDNHSREPVIIIHRGRTGFVSRLQLFNMFLSLLEKDKIVQLA